MTSPSRLKGRVHFYRSPVVASGNRLGTGPGTIEFVAVDGVGNVPKTERGWWTKLVNAVRSNDRDTWMAMLETLQRKA